jgi:hypothetical protein
VVADQLAGEADKIGAKVVSHGRYVTFQMVEVAVSQKMFADILMLITRLRAPRAPEMTGDGVRGDRRRRERSALMTGNPRVPASPGGRSVAPTVIGAGCAQIFLPGKGKRPTIALITLSIWGLSVKTEVRRKFAGRYKWSA